MSSTSDHVDFRSLIEDLRDAAARIDADDLRLLAKMHGWCETLAGGSPSAGPQADSTIGAAATELAQSLESVILGQAADPHACLLEINKTVEQLAVRVGIAPPAGQTSTALTDTAPDANGADCGAREDSETELPVVIDNSASPAAQRDKVSSPEPAATGVPKEAPTGSPQGAVPAPAAESPTMHTPAPPQPGGEPPHQSEPLVIDNKELEFVKAFVEETGEHIENIEQALLEVERAPTNLDKINDLFRPFHTIKGMAGFLHLRDVNCLTHEAETVLDQARKGKRPVNPALIDLIFDVVDILKTQVASLADYLVNPNGQAIPQPPVAQMIQRLRDIIAGRAEPATRDSSSTGSGRRTGEALVDNGVVAREVVDFALRRQKEEAGSRKVGEILMEMGAVNARQLSQALRTQARPVEPAAKAGTDTSIRIDTTKLDSLIDAVGELVIAQTLVQANTTVTTDLKLSRDVDQVTKIVRDIQEVAMGMRMIPIGPTFQKMGRLVRDLSRKIDKQVNLVVSGEETELDKNYIQQLGDPLVHMVRNAVDHGIETPDARAAAGKPPTGTVRLHAGHQGSSVVIEVSDDGQGLDPKVLIAKGIEKGLVQPDEELTDQQACALILAPGFSTAAEITDVSGRGVGMDVVKRNIEELRGKIEISSRLGCGTTFTIKLPLTLAIIDGMVIRLGPERFIIPTIMIEQSLRPQPSQISTVLHKGEVLNVRGQLIPLIQLGQMFGLTPGINPSETMVVIAHCEGRQIGLVVEELIGQQQVVIKSLGKHFERLKGISGAAILGDGRVGLILEMAGLVQLHARQASQRIPRLSFTPGGTDDRCSTGGPAADAETPIGSSAPEPALM